MLLALLAGLAGCASPGPPLPPSLKLPAVVEANGFTATRVGDTVRLHWTTPARTTDKLLIAGPITAVICRNSASATPPATPARPAKAATCSEVARQPVTSGASDAVDPLPAALATGPPRLLAYRVELLNAAGRTAGPSAEVFAAAGEAPAPVADFRGETAKAGALLRWRMQTGPGEAVELERTTVAPPATANAPSPAAPPKSTLPTGLPGQKEPAVARFRAGAADAVSADPGGTLDRTAQIGRTYTYTAQRVRTVLLGGQSLELRSPPSPAVTVPMRDIFPPDVPTGLVAVPDFFSPSDQRSPGTPGAGEGAAQHPAIDLSWEPDIEPRVAGYRVYRREGDAGSWQRLTAEPVPVPSWRDATVVAGHTYSYRVTAVSTARNESAPSAEATETAPAQ